MLLNALRGIEQPPNKELSSAQNVNNAHVEKLRLPLLYYCHST